MISQLKQHLSSISRIGVALMFILAFGAGCKKDHGTLPDNMPELLQGEWHLVKMTVKSWKGNVRIGGGGVRQEITLNIDTARFDLRDDLNQIQVAGPFDLIDDSLIFHNEIDTNEEPERFQIQRLNEDELYLLTAFETDTLIGKVYNENVYKYER
jgi:hypothetical protein